MVSILCIISHTAVNANDSKTKNKRMQSHDNVINDKHPSNVSVDKQHENSILMTLCVHS